MAINSNLRTQTTTLSQIMNEEKKPQNPLWGWSNKLNSAETSSARGAVFIAVSVHQRWGGNAAATRSCIPPQSLLDPRHCLTHPPLQPSRDAQIWDWAATDTEQDSSAPLQGAEPPCGLAPVAIPCWVIQLLCFCPDLNSVPPQSTPFWAHPGTLPGLPGWLHSCWSGTIWCCSALPAPDCNPVTEHLSSLSTL